MLEKKNLSYELTQLVSDVLISFNVSLTILFMIDSIDSMIPIQALSESKSKTI